MRQGSALHAALAAAFAKVCAQLAARYRATFSAIVRDVMALSAMFHVRRMNGSAPAADVLERIGVSHLMFNL